jgi:hypothetical protein
MNNQLNDNKNSGIKGNIKKIFSLSPMQEGMLYHSLLDNKSSAYFEQTVISINGDLNIDFLGVWCGSIRQAP